MIDFFIGKSLTPNQPKDDVALPIQKTIRELLCIARNIQRDRRKNTSERRRLSNDDFIINLSHRREKRSRVERRQNQAYLLANSRIRNQRKNKIDRRSSVNNGVYVKLSTKNDKRSGIDRRGN